MQLPQFQAHAEMEEKHWWFLSRIHILRTLLAEILPSKGNIVDVGCGTGGVTAALSSNHHVVGIDPIPEAIESAVQRFPGVDFVCGTAPEDIPEQMQQADVVLIMDVLEHVEDDFLFTSKLFSSMKPGAHLILMAPADPELWGAHDKGFEHYRRYTLERLRLLWRDLPVEERAASYCNAHLYPLIKIARSMSRKRGKSFGKNDTDISVPFFPINKLLYLLFSSEAKTLKKLLKGKRKKGFAHGVSVFAVLRRGEGEIQPRAQPEGVSKDERPWMHLETRN
tara:strand:- start:83 stop:922 length:840 start_codon:yes stop_codon:yes gene_type:complete